MGPESKFAKSGTALGDLEIAWSDRLDDSDALLSADRFASAIAAGLYSLEVYLKVKICKRLDLDHLPRAFETHDLDGLLILCGLSRRMNFPSKKLDIAVKRNWDSVRDLSYKLLELRYSDGSKWTRKDAESFLDQLKNPKHGVLSWLQKQK
jgi:hypothetical protein